MVVKMTEQEIRKEILKMGHQFGRLHMIMRYGNVSRAEFGVLMVVKRSQESVGNEKGVYVSRLAKELRVSSPAVSRMLGNLESKGLIGRDVDKENRRNTYVYLTKRGKEEIAGTERLLDESVRRIIRRMGKENIEQLLYLWGKMIRIMEEEAAKMPSGEAPDNCPYIPHEFLIRKGEE